MIMNPCLQMSKIFDDKKKDNFGYSGKPTFYASKPVTLKHLEELHDDLVKMEEYWKKQSVLGEVTLISSFCYEMIAKSSRISELFHYRGIKANDLIVGALLEKDGSHVFTYKLTKTQLHMATELLMTVIHRFQEVFGNQVTADQVVQKRGVLKSTDELKKTSFIKIIRELSYVKSFGVYLTDKTSINEAEIVTLFDMKDSTKDLLGKLNLEITSDFVIDDTLLLLTPKEYKKLYQEAPYLIAMSVSDFTQMPPIDKPRELNYISPKNFPKPENEPLIGVIDTLFDDKVYFSNWVESHVLIDGEKRPEDFKHGTAVTSLIVDLPDLMPSLDDHCGKFRVKHFGVTRSRGTSSFYIMKKIKEIVKENPDIHVWNLSLGSTREINPNCISPEAAMLDDLQRENPNIIFVIAGTNLDNQVGEKYIGAPADSINSLVVNSVKQDETSASYSRHGPALGFFVKPDVSYYGGDEDQELVAFVPEGTHSVSGTSFAAPLISRKLAYLMEIMKIPRNCAKAMLIDSAVGWKEEKDINKIGHGVVPIKIEDVVGSNDSEIKMYIQGSSEKYFTYTYDLPVPIDSKTDKFPYEARATFCYTPKCTRCQGVDYSNLELNLKFGRVKPGASGGIESINHDHQGQEAAYIKEQEARKNFRKWDNTKVLKDTYRKKPQAKKKFGSDYWGIGVSYINRDEPVLSADGKKEIESWGLVITLRATDKKNRLDEFVQKCKLEHWFVNKVVIENRLDLLNEANQEIEFDE